MATPKNASEAVGVPVRGIVQRVEQYRASVLTDEPIDRRQFLEETHLTPKIEEIALSRRRQVIRVPQGGKVLPPFLVRAPAR